MNVGASCTGSASPYKCAPQGLDPIDAGYNAADPAELVPDFGVSDVAPFMFKDPLNVEAGAVQLNLTEAGYLSQFPVQSVGMGIVATSEIPDTANLSQAEYGAMLTGNIYDWSQVKLSPAGLGADTTIHPVVVCRRVPGSGTQASYNWFFNNFPCTSLSQISGTSGATSPARMTDSAGYGAFGGDGSSAANAIGVDVTAGYTVIENQGSGDVRKCLKAAQSGGNYTFLDENNKYHVVNFGSGHYGAIGVLSLDSQQKTADGAESLWYFRPMDGNGFFHYATQTCTSSGTVSGVCPSKQNLLQGRYAFAAESTMQYRNAASGHALSTKIGRAHV